MFNIQTSWKEKGSYLINVSKSFTANNLFTVTIENRERDLFVTRINKGNECSNISIFTGFERQLRLFAFSNYILHPHWTCRWSSCFLIPLYRAHAFAQLPNYGRGPFFCLLMYSTLAIIKLTHTGLDVYSARKHELALKPYTHRIFGFTWVPLFLD